VSTYLSVWDAIEDDPVQAEVMKVRSDLMRKICERLTGAGWGRVEAARRCGVTTPRLDELTGGKVDRFTLEDLIRIGTKLGVRVSVFQKGSEK
jgi:predicted XRE-type DNA-binding protein